ncbi:family 43 glycosylhydrolase [Cohnella sp. CFH 77786]|uniref:glycoside hydrolase family 43 protein n=1 Tax=Cohnella sp. CFH 77786 TaxID=2662265 RepID=UPI001C60CD39|nr:family 43 glycosylhydrolase [Cohnella sp. CFH 77786]MBW5447851.1 family 43 glycosylhydrolase [Cohnella sp. CFH 77786]
MKRHTTEIGAGRAAPVVLQRADPWVYRHTDGFYYFTASVPEYDRIELRRSATIQGLADAVPTAVWRKHESGRMSSHIWAPEIHYIDGKWYVYFAAAPSGDTVKGMFDHRMFVLENEAEDPFQGTWVEKGQIATARDSFSLDATTFEHGGVRYLVWAQHDPDVPGHSNLYLAPMRNPWTLTGPQLMLTKPELHWETRGFLVNEGPAVLRKNGRIFISYSASATDHNYCMGLLAADEHSDLMNADAWTKWPQPIFETDEENGLYGPGHNCFTVSEDGAAEVFVFHARNYKEIEGDPLYDPNRHMYAKTLAWDNDGNPVFR